MSFGSFLRNLGNKIARPFEKNANTTESFFKSLGNKIFNAEKSIETGIEQAVAKDLSPIVEGIAALTGVSAAENILQNPFGNSLTQAKNSLTDFNNHVFKCTF